MMTLLKNDALGKLVLRLSVGLLMILHGYAKINNPGSLDWISGQLSGVGLPSILAYSVYIGEIVAPLMIIAGVYCRWGALIMVVNMLFAIGLAHSGQLFSMTSSGGWAVELQGLYLFAGLALMFLGSGRLAVKPD